MRTLPTMDTKLKSVYFPITSKFKEPQMIQSLLTLLMGAALVSGGMVRILRLAHGSTKLDSVVTLWYTLAVEVMWKAWSYTEWGKPTCLVGTHSIFMFLAMNAMTVSSRETLYMNPTIAAYRYMARTTQPSQRTLHTTCPGIVTISRTVLKKITKYRLIWRLISTL
mmetsp:Transcript_43566/g.92626  ORF Transcript_43566/g.92626 Transcript_43566/m.92626 type:complete len:166 (+) Transcript_43566:215-712(+)